MAPFIVDLPIKAGDFPSLFVGLPGRVNMGLITDHVLAATAFFPGADSPKSKESLADLVKRGQRESKGFKERWCWTQSLELVVKGGPSGALRGAPGVSKWRHWSWGPLLDELPEVLLNF